jgi:methylthioxylose transferase
MRRRPNGRQLMVVLACVASGLVLLAVWRGWLRLEVPGQHWFLRSNFAWGPLLLLPCGALLLLAAALREALAGNPRRQARGLVVAAVFCAYVLAVGTRVSGRFGFVVLATTILCDGSNSYFRAAAEAPDALALARDYPRQMPRLPLHATTQSPGAMLLHAALRRLGSFAPAQDLATGALLLWPHQDPPGVVGVLNRLWQVRYTAADLNAALFIALVFPLVGALGAWPVFALARRLSGTRVALLTTALYAVTPSLIWFTASVDQLYPALAAVVVLLLHDASRGRGSTWRLLLAGALTGLGIFLNFGLSVLAAIGGAYLLFAGYVEARRQPRLAARLVLGSLGLYAAGALAVLAAVRWGLRIDLLAVARTSSGLRTLMFTVQYPRPYLTWLLLNPVEFSLGMGFAATALVLAALGLCRKSTGQALPLLAAVLLVLGGLNLAGVARAEWSRMLLFAMPLCLIGAGAALRRLGLTRPLPALALVLSQGLFALVGYQLFDVWGHWILPFR